MWTKKRGFLAMFLNDLWSVFEITVSWNSTLKQKKAFVKGLQSSYTWKSWLLKTDLCQYSFINNTHFKCSCLCYKYSKHIVQTVKHKSQDQWVARRIWGSKDWEELAVFFGDTAVDERTLFFDPVLSCTWSEESFVQVCAGVKFLLIYTNWHLALK